MSSTQKILVGIVSCSVPPSCSGQSIVLKRLLIENESLDCFIFSENLEGEARELPKHYTLEVAAPAVHKGAADVGDGSKIRFAKSYLKLIWKRADQLVDGIKKNRLNMLIACTGDPLDIPATMVASLRTGKPFFVYLFDDATYQWTSPRLRKICGYIESVWSKLAAGAICPNQSLADEYLQRRNLKVKILANNIGL